jgi:cytochrome c oxidase assembly factor CtaG
MSRLRLCSFVAGLAVVVGAQLAPLDGRFSTHMLQHLLIGDLGPLLIVLGRPPRSRAALALPLWAATLVAWHLTPLYDAALRHESIHLLQHATFLVAGLALWSVLLGTELPTAWKLPYVLGMWVVSLTLSQVFLWSGHAYYGRYTLADQREGGGVMLVEGSFVMLGVVVWLLLRVFRESEERQHVLETGIAE